jgi:hypothetical protein
VSTLSVSFAASADDVDDVVGALERRGFPCQGRGGGYLVLHGVTVGRVATSASTSAVLRAVEGTELLLFLHEDQERCVASAVFVRESRVVVQLNLAEAPADEVKAAALAVERLLDGLPDVRLEGSLALG